MPIGAIVGGIATVGSAVIGSNAASKAAKTQAAAAKAANDTEYAIYQQQREDFAPWRQAGLQGLTEYANFLGLNGEEKAAAAIDRFRSSPGYEFGLTEGVRAIDRGAAASGLINSGARLRALQQYGADYADTKSGEYLNRLAALSGTGQSATQSTAQAGQNYANAYGINAMNAANARASGYINQANAITGGINNALSLGAYGAGQGWFGGGNALTAYGGGGSLSKYKG